MRYTIAGSAHEPGLIAVVDGVPSGLRVSSRSINADVTRWNRLNGRPREDADYQDAELMLGVRDGRTTGNPVVLYLDRAEDFALGSPADARHAVLDALGRETFAVPHPGTSELAGALKRNFDDCLDVAGRADASTAVARVAAAGVAREFLADFGVEIHSYVTRIGEASMRENEAALEGLAYAPLDIETSSLRCPSAQATRAMEAEIDAAAAAGVALGGQFRLVVTGVVPGLGDYATPGASLAACLAAAVFSVDDVCGVSFGERGVAASAAIDAPVLGGPFGFSRARNRAGGIEGGVSSGLPIMMLAQAAPPPFTSAASASLDMETLEPAQARCRSYDACRVPSAAVLAESEVAFALARAYIEKFGGDAMADTHKAVEAYRERLARAAR